MLACGATRIDGSGSTLLGEAGWNQGFADTDTQVDSFGAVGGGISAVTEVPSWQAGLPMPASVTGGPKGRGVPDVTGNGDPASGYKVLVGGKGTVVGGTSAVAPLWAGLIARVNQQLGRRVGFVNPALYAAQQRLIMSSCRATGSLAREEMKTSATTRPAGGTPAVVSAAPSAPR